jgi:hypothetical protein
MGFIPDNGGSSSFTLGTSADCQIINPTNNQSLVYEGTVWRNKTLNDKSRRKKEPKVVRKSRYETPLPPMVKVDPFRTAPPTGGCNIDIRGEGGH